MENKKAANFKFFAKVFDTIGTIVCFVIAYNAATTSSMFGGDKEFKFSTFVITFILYFVIVQICSLFIYAIGEIMQMLQDIFDKVDEITVSQKSSVPQESSVNRSVSNRKIDILSQHGKNTTDVWKCPNCESKNLLSQICCKDCGTYK